MSKKAFGIDIGGSGTGSGLASAKVRMPGTLS